MAPRRSMGTHLSYSYQLAVLPRRGGPGPMGRLEPPVTAGPVEHCTPTVSSDMIAAWMIR
jgi:hypothetical protein